MQDKPFYTITAWEGSEILAIAKYVMHDLGCGIEAGEAEDAELFLARIPTVAQCRARADFVLPPGKRGRVLLTILPPPAARATAFIAAILRAVR